MTPGDMLFVEHLNELRRRFLRTALITFSIMIFCTIFGIQLLNLNDVTFYFVYPTVYNNIASQVTIFFSEMLIPDGVELIQTTPGQSLYAQIHVAILLGVTAAIPIIAMELLGFIKPAISNESFKNSTFNLVLPVTLLFACGILFSFFIVIPITLNFLYQYGQSIGILSFLNISDFIQFVLQFFIAFGISFQLPLVMFLLSSNDLVNFSFWLKNSKYAIIIFIIFGALITPDGSGLTMWFITLPMMMLYGLGMFLIKIRQSRFQRLRSSI